MKIKKSELLKVGKNIRKYRRKRKLSPANLARLIEADESLISRIENNQRIPTIESIWRIASALECDYSDLLPKLNHD